MLFCWCLVFPLLAFTVEPTDKQRTHRPLIYPGKYVPAAHGIIGIGAEGTVSLVRRIVDDQTLAAKCFRPKPAKMSEDEYYGSIRLEHQISLQLQHPNIIQVEDLVEGTQSPCQIMEYCPMNLRQALHTGTLSLGQINCIFWELLSAVAYMHSMGYAHRDLKPGNVMIDPRGVAKLIDFGTVTVIRDLLEGEIIRIHGQFQPAYPHD
jgi:serine/threonine protein kinase